MVRARVPAAPLLALLLLSAGGLAAAACGGGSSGGPAGTAIVVRALPGPTLDLTGTTWASCYTGEPAAGQSQRRSEAYALGQVTHLEETFPASETCAGTPDAAQRAEVVATVTLLGDRVVGWNGTPPAGLPAEVTATAIEVKGTWTGTGQALSFRSLRFVDARTAARRIYEGKEAPAPDGVPTLLETGGREEAVPPAFGQGDLTGEWDVVMLSTNPGTAWIAFHARLGATGQAEVLEWHDHTGSTAAPASFDLVAAVDGAGTVTLSGGYTGEQFHGSMTAAKTLVFATDQKGGAGMEERHLWVWRKRVAGVTYGAADLASASFATHGLYSGAAPRWEHGAASTDASGALTVTSLLDSDGGSAAPGLLGTLAVDAAGVVTMPGTDLRGVMTPDKRALFVVHTTGDVGAPSLALHVLQRTGRTFAQGDLAGRYAFHGVASGAGSATSLWNHGTVTVDEGGHLTFTGFLGSGGVTALPAPRTYLLSAEGGLTQPDLASFHGQLSWGEDWYVRTSGAAGAAYLAFVAR